MDRAQIEGMLKEQETTMKRLQENALRVQGSILTLREMLKKIDEAAAPVPEE